MDYQKLKYFISVARHLSFTKGANECHVSQAVISRQIAALEAELGTQLFLRSGRQIELTQAGDLFMYEAVFMLQHYNSVIQRFNKMKPGVRGTLTIGFGPVEAILLKKILPGFMEAYPDVLVNCQQFSYSILPFRFTRGLLDIVLSTEKCSKAFGSIRDSIEIYPSKWYIAAHENHPYWSLSIRDQSILKNQDLIILESDFDDQFELDCISSGFQVNNFIQTNFGQSQLLMLESKIGIAFVPAFLIDSLPAYIHSKPMAIPSKESAFTLSKNKEKINPCAETFVNYALECLKDF